MKRLIEFFVQRVGDLALGILCVAAVATFAGKLHWILDIASHFQVYYFVLAVWLLVGNLVFRRRRQALIALVLTGIGVFHLSPYFLPNGTAAGDGKTYKAMQLNLNLTNQKTAAVKAAISEADPDILVLQEVTPRWNRELKSISKGFRHEFALPEENAFGIWVLSKFELVDIDIQRRDGIGFLHVKYKAGGKVLELVALHPVPPISGQDSKNRNALLKDAAVYAAGEGSRLAVGDFNCSPWSPHFKTFLKSSDLRDSANGRGIKSTWFPFPIPLPLGIPIDHVLVSPDIEVVEREVGGDVGSDHRAVVVTFRIGKSN